MSAVTLQIALPILDPECSDKLKIEAQYILTNLNPVHKRSAQTLQVFEWLNIFTAKAYFMLTRVSFKRHFNLKSIKYQPKKQC